MFFVIAILLVREIQEWPSGGASAGAEATKVLNDLRNVRSAIHLAASDEGRPPRTYIYDNAAFNEKFGGYFDRPLRARAYSFVIVLDDSTTGDVFTGLIASRSPDVLMNDKDVRRKLAAKAHDAGLLKNIRGEFYDGGDVIMMLFGNFPALKEGAQPEE
jgi:hypothetical protein